MTSSCMFNGRGSQQHGHSRSRDLYLPTGNCSPPVDSSTDDFVQRSSDGAFVRGVIKGTECENSSIQSKWPTARNNLLAALPNIDAVEGRYPTSATMPLSTATMTPSDRRPMLRPTTTRRQAGNAESCAVTVSQTKKTSREVADVTSNSAHALTSGLSRRLLERTTGSSRAAIASTTGAGHRSIQNTGVTQRASAGVMSQSGVSTTDNGSGQTQRSRPAYKHVPHRDKPPHLVARRNARERRRVQAVNGAFLRLRRHLPVNSAVGKNKRLSKVKTLRTAIEYIGHLQRLIQDGGVDSENNDSGLVADGNDAGQQSMTSPSRDFTNSGALHQSHPGNLFQQQPHASSAVETPPSSLGSRAGHVTMTGCRSGTCADEANRPVANGFRPGLRLPGGQTQLIDDINADIDDNECCSDLTDDDGDEDEITTTTSSTTSSVWTYPIF